MPAGTRDDSNARLDGRLVKIAHEILSSAARCYLKAAIGQAGAKRGSVTMQVLICDGMLMNDSVVVLPLQQTGPAITLRIANAADDLERSGQPNMLFPFFISAPFFDGYE